MCVCGSFVLCFCLLGVNMGIEEVRELPLKLA